MSTPCSALSFDHRHTVAFHFHHCCRGSDEQLGTITLHQLRDQWHHQNAMSGSSYASTPLRSLDDSPTRRQPDLQPSTLVAPRPPGRNGLAPFCVVDTDNIDSWDGRRPASSPGLVTDLLTFRRCPDLLMGSALFWSGTVLGPVPWSLSRGPPYCLFTRLVTGLLSLWMLFYLVAWLPGISRL